MPLRIIYLDDEVDLLDVFSDFYSGPHFEIETYSEVDKAIKAINSRAPDLLILDYRLPNTTGDVIAKKVAPNIPKIIITGDLSITCRSQFLRVFHKPYDLTEMQDFLDSRLRLKDQAA